VDTAGWLVGITGILNREEKPIAKKKKEEKKRVKGVIWGGHWEQTGGKWRSRKLGGK